MLDFIKAEETLMSIGDLLSMFLDLKGEVKWVLWMYALSVGGSMVVLA